MKLVKKGKAKQSRNKHRIRRFHCDLCEITTTIHADGERDLIIEPLDAIIKGGNINNPQDQERLLEILEKGVTYDS